MMNSELRFRHQKMNPKFFNRWLMNYEKWQKTKLTAKRRLIPFYKSGKINMCKEKNTYEFQRLLCYFFCWEKIEELELRRSKRLQKKALGDY